VELPLAPQRQIRQGTKVEVEETSPAETAETSIPRPETSSTNHPQSEEANSTTPTTPSSIQQSSAPAPGDTTPVAAKPTKKLTIPAVPIIPALPKAAPRDITKQATEKAPEEVQPEQPTIEVKQEEKAEDGSAVTNETEVQPPPKAWATPKLWTGLFNANTSTTAPAASGSGAGSVSGIFKTNAESLAEALRSFNAVSNDSKVSFLEPRGLVNTGNMCYMNSVSIQPTSILGRV
jgi:ubiquitin carboxyl-terminal hydrolase 10